MTLQKELSELREARDTKNSEVFQKFFAEPIYKKLTELKGAYDCKTLQELATLKGKQEAYQYFISLLKGIDEDIEIKSEQLKSDEA